MSLKQITRSYDDAEGLQTLAQCAQAVTTEFENVPAKSLAALAALGLPTAPHADAVAATQDRNVEKSFIERTEEMRPRRTRKWLAPHSHI